MNDELDNMRCIAIARMHDPLNTWPDHNDYHRRTLMGNWLFDEGCLRCYLENELAKYLKTKAEVQEQVS